MWKWRGSKRRLKGSGVFGRDKHSNRGPPLRPVHVHVHVSLHHRDLFPFFPPPTPARFHRINGWKAAGDPLILLLLQQNHVASSGGKLSWIYAQPGLFFCLFVFPPSRAPNWSEPHRERVSRETKNTKYLDGFFFSNHIHFPFMSGNNRVWAHRVDICRDRAHYISGITHICQYSIMLTS